jgi:hypothetical protein
MDIGESLGTFEREFWASAPLFARCAVENWGKGNGLGPDIFGSKGIPRTMQLILLNGYYYFATRTAVRQR